MGAEVNEDVALEAYVEAAAVANLKAAEEEKSFVEVVTAAAAELAACFVDMLVADYLQEEMDVDREEEEELLKALKLALKSSVLLEMMNQVMG